MFVQRLPADLRGWGASRLVLISRFCLSPASPTQSTPHGVPQVRGGQAISIAARSTKMLYAHTLLIVQRVGCTHLLAWASCLGMPDPDHRATPARTPIATS